MAWNGPYSLGGGGGSSISNGGTTLAIDGSGNLTTTTAVGASVDLTANPGNGVEISNSGGVTISGQLGSIAIGALSDVTITLDYGGSTFQVLTYLSAGILTFGGSSTLLIQVSSNNVFEIDSSGNVTIQQNVIVVPFDTNSLGFFNTTPTTQPTANGVTAGFVEGSGEFVTDDATFTGNVGSSAYTIGDLVAALKNLGLIES
jgi:hypothetical protein